MRLYANSALCTGCRACQAACSLNLFNQTNPKMAALLVLPFFPEPGEYRLKVCTQCGECAAVCPTNAIQKNDRGIYRVIPELCDLCEACVAACPEEVMFVKAGLAEHSWKCDLCGDCVAVCGTDALQIGQ